MSRYLDMVDAPEHVKKLKLDQLQSLAEDIRNELIESLSKHGGHLGPNLGVGADHCPALLFFDSKG